MALARPFLLEAIFWESLACGALRALGLVQRRPYRVLLGADPIAWRGPGGRGVEAGGLYTTRIVMAGSEEEAGGRAVKAVRADIDGMLHWRPGASARVTVEGVEALSGVVWRQVRGASIYLHSGGACE